MCAFPEAVLEMWKAASFAQIKTSQGACVSPFKVHWKLINSECYHVRFFTLIKKNDLGMSIRFIEFIELDWGIELDWPRNIIIIIQLLFARLSINPSIHSFCS